MKLNTFAFNNLPNKFSEVKYLVFNNLPNKFSEVKYFVFNNLPNNYLLPLCLGTLTVIKILASGLPN